MQAHQAHLDLIEWWDRQGGLKWAEGFVGSTRESEHHANMFPQSMTGEKLAAAEGVRLNSSPTYFVTEEMVETFAHASRTWPGQSLESVDIPSPYGFVYLHKPIIVQDVRGNLAAIRAMSWGPAFVEKSKWDEFFYDHGAEPDGVEVFFYSDASDARDPHSAELMQYRLQINMPVLMLYHVGWWIFGQDPNEERATPRAREHIEPEGGADVPLSMHDWMLAFWTIIQQHIVVRVKSSPPRALARRAQRIAKQPEFGDIQIITLRRAKYPQHFDDGREPQEVMWSHRWVVHGFWRNQWYPSLGIHRRIFVPDFVKGPEHLPLVLKDRIFSVSR